MLLSWGRSIRAKGIPRDGVRIPKMRRFLALSLMGIAVALLAATKGVDEKLAKKGAALFKSKGCTACHTVGKGKLVGPDLKGVTERREYDWLVAMITNPDSMLKYDPVAKELLKEYKVPMTDQNVSKKEAKAIIEYLRKESQK